jgi:MOSC domain-containing protein YiiM
MRLQSIQVGKPRELGTPGSADPLEKPWTSGYGKSPVRGPVFCGRLNLEGDGQFDLRWHGGPETAVLAYPADHYPRWRADGAWPDAAPGALGENLTVEGTDEDSACIGDVWEAGEVRLQISEPRKPCNNISKFHHRQELLRLVIETGRFGWYLRVLREGRLEAGQEVRLVERPHPGWTVARAMRARLGKKKDPVSAAALAALPALGADWREILDEKKD